MSVRFNVGDRVVSTKECLADNELIHVGSTGVIVGYYSSPDNICHVQWDDHVNGHDCYGLADFGHGWNVFDKDIELADEYVADIAAPSNIELLFG